MLLRRLTDFILSSRLRAAGTAFATAFIPIPGGNLGVLIAGLVTLQQGAYAGSLVFCSAIAASFLGCFLFQTPETAWVLSVVTLAGFGLSFLTWLLVLVLRVTGSWALVTELGALIGLVLILGLHWAFPGLDQWWVHELTTYFHQANSIIGQFLPGSVGLQKQFSALPSKALSQWIEAFSHYATGFLVACLLFNTLLQVLLARAWETVLYMPGRLRQELYFFQPGLFAGVAAVLLLVLIQIGSRIALDMLPVFVLIFALAGLSLTHLLMSRVRGGRLGLILVYAALVMLFPFGLIGIAIPGLLDVWLNFRKKVNAFKK